MVRRLDVGGAVSCGGTCGFSSENLHQNNGTSKAETGNGEVDIKIKACRLKGEEEETKMIMNTINIIYFQKIPP